jgi:DHA1 family bicyclomycin/chloramphenicol resistance-like MFS transporter
MPYNGNLFSTRIIMALARSQLIFILAAIVALGPLSVDMYLPSMPSMVVFFGTTISRVQLTLSSYLLGFALFHLVCGPLSDRYGRKPVLLGGLGVYVVMSMACAMASSIEQLIIFRFLQAIGACCAPTLGRAVVRDIFPPHEAVKALAYVSSLMAVAPVIAPTLGGVLVTLGDWRLSFWVLAFAGVVAMGLTAFCIPESLPQKQVLSFKNISTNYLTLLRNPDYMGCVLTSACLYSGAFAFVSGAGFVLIQFLGVKPTLFGMYFLANVVGYVTGNLVTARVAHAWSPNTLFKTGIAIALVPGMLMVLFAWLKWYHPLLIVLPAMFVTLGIGLVLPQSMALALKPYPHMAATASALMGFIQMSVSSIAGGLVGYFLVDNPLPFALVICGTSLVSLLSYWLFLSKRRLSDL